MAVSRINEAGLNVNQYGNRNLIINGAMQVAQRGTSATGKTTQGYYSLDRWNTDIGSAGTWTIAQSSTAPDGFANSLKVDCTATQTDLSGDKYFLVQQRIEAQNLFRFKFGNSSALPITVSFYVRSNKTGTYYLNLYNTDNSRQNGRTYTIDAADTWEYKTISFDADTAQGFNNDTGIGLMLEWWLVAGTSYTSGSVPTAWQAHSNTNRGAGLAVNLADSTSNEWLITGVQLEVGDTATDFEHRTFADELIRCQRYYEQQDGLSGTTIYGVGYNESTSQARGIIPLKVIKRAAPTVTVSAAGDFANVSTATTYAASSLSFDAQSPFNIRYLCTSSTASLVDGGASNLQRFTGDAIIEIDAEL